MKDVDSQSGTPPSLENLACIRTGHIKKLHVGLWETGGTSLEFVRVLGLARAVDGVAAASTPGADLWITGPALAHTQAPSARLHQTEGERQSWATPRPHTHTHTQTNPLQRISKMGSEVVVCGEGLLMSQCNLRHLENSLSFQPKSEEIVGYYRTGYADWNIVFLGFSCHVSSVQPASGL